MTTTPPSLTVVTWNLALLARSHEAPSSWTQEHTEAALRDHILDWSPDLVLFQELPGIVPFVETHDLVRANPRSHSGHLAILIGHHLLDETTSVAVVDGCAILLSFPHWDLTVANVHLAPGRGATGLRLGQLQTIIDTAPTEAVAIVGDTNTRTAEEVALQSLGLDTPRPPSPTWDSRRNRFHPPLEPQAELDTTPTNGAPPTDSAGFIAYFSRALTLGSWTVADQAVRPGLTTMNGQSFHLSDHYALQATLESTTQQPTTQQSTP